MNRKARPQSAPKSTRNPPTKSRVMPHSMQNVLTEASRRWQEFVDESSTYLDESLPHGSKSLLSKSMLFESSDVGSEQPQKETRDQELGIYEKLAGYEEISGGHVRLNIKKALDGISPPRNRSSMRKDRDSDTDEAGSDSDYRDEFDQDGPRQSTFVLGSPFKHFESHRIPIPREKSMASVRESRILRQSTGSTSGNPLKSDALPPKIHSEKAWTEHEVHKESHSQGFHENGKKSKRIANIHNDHDESLGETEGNMTDEEFGDFGLPVDRIRDELLSYSTILKEQSQSLSLRERIVEEKERDIEARLADLTRREKEFETKEDLSSFMDQESRLHDNDMTLLCTRLEKINTQQSSQIEKLQQQVADLQKKLALAQDQTQSISHRYELLQLQKASNKQAPRSRKSSEVSDYQDYAMLIKQYQDIVFVILPLYNEMKSQENDSKHVLFADNHEIGPKVLPALYATIAHLQSDDTELQKQLLEFSWSCMHMSSDFVRTSMYTSTMNRFVKLITGSMKSTSRLQFVESRTLSVKILSCLVVLWGSHQADLLCSVLDHLKSAMSLSEAKVQLLKYNGASVLVKHLQQSNPAILEKVVTIYLSLSMESEFLSHFLYLCLSEDFFKGCDNAFKADIQSVQESLSVLLQKLSKLRGASRYFQVNDLVGTLMQLQRKTTSRFLKLNIESILTNLGVRVAP